MAAAATSTQDERLSPAELRAWRGLHCANASLVKALDGQLEATHGLPLSSYEVLHRLAEAEGARMRMHDIASSVRLSRSGLTRLVDRLERDGLVERVSCSDDARGAFACLTTAGAAKLEETRVTYREGVRRHFFSRFDAAELELLANLLDRIAPEHCCSQPDA